MSKDILKAEGWTIKTEWHENATVIDPDGKEYEFGGECAEDIIDQLQDGFTTASETIEMLETFISEGYAI